MAEKVAIADKWINRGYRATLVLRIVGVSRSTYYKKKVYRLCKELGVLKPQMSVTKHSCEIYET